MEKSHAHHDIDASAGEARTRFITSVAGQEATYLLKSAQALSFKNVGYTGTVPGLVQAEANALQQSPQLAADRILAEEAAWAGVAAHIEYLRRAGKIAISAATTPEEVMAICASFQTQLDNVKM